MMRDSLSKVRIEGLRAIDDISLKLGGLTVLIGDNGTGKSSLLEAFELLRLAAKPGLNFVEDVLERHFGGLPDLIRRGSKELRISALIEGGGLPLEYSFSIGLVGTSGEVLRERLDLYERPGSPEPLHVLIRDRTRLKIFDYESRKLVTPAPIEPDRQMLALTYFGLAVQPALERALKALSNIDFQVPFETRSIWQLRELDLRQGPRWPSEVKNVERLVRFGLNLPSCFQELRNRGFETWERVLNRCRLALGEDLRDFRMVPSRPGNLELEVVLGTWPDRPLPVSALSEGQLSYLLLVALVELDHSRSLLVFDEPESHLHPALLARALFMLEAAAAEHPVILATHSDRLLDSIEDPAKSVVLCELDERRAMRLLRPDSERLASWLEDYRGLGSLRAEGYEAHVFQAEPI